MATKNRFFSRIPSCKYIFKNGKEAAFVGGIFDTDIPQEVAELEAEVAAGHPQIFIDPDQFVIDTAQIDPLAEIKRKAIEEYLAAQKAASDPANDRGTTEESKLNVTSTADISGAAADSSAGQVVATTSAPSVVKVSK